MAKRPEQEAHRWLAAGHRYDNVDLWQELCAFLDVRGLVPTAELPDHLAPLAFRDPQNTYQEWLREQHLLPIAHLKGRSASGGNGWRTHRDWRDRLAVMRDPTPEKLLAWWRALEPVMRADCLKRSNSNIPIFDPTVPGHYRLVAIPRYHCTFCKGTSWSDDPRGVLHEWRSNLGVPDCALVRLSVQIREAGRRAPGAAKRPLVPTGRSATARREAVPWHTRR